MYTLKQALLGKGQHRLKEECVFEGWGQQVERVKETSALSFAIPMRAELLIESEISMAML